MTADAAKPRPVVLVVDDEESYVEALQVGLAREGYRVEVARDGMEAIEVFRRVGPDLVLLDVMLPRLSGIDVCREIRRRSAVPIIMVTAKSSELDTVVGLEVGADDYVSKPYRLRELVARIRAALRRSGEASVAATGAGADGSGRDEDPAPSVDVGGIVIDLDQHLVTVDGETVTLPLKEFELLHMLAANAGRVMTRETLIDRIWGFDYVGDTKTLDVHIKRLRAKVERDPSRPERITTVRGLGYKMERPRTT